MEQTQPYRPSSADRSSSSAAPADAASGSTDPPSRTAGADPTDIDHESPGPSDDNLPTRSGPTVQRPAVRAEGRVRSSRPTAHHKVSPIIVDRLIKSYNGTSPYTISASWSSLAG